QYLSRDPLSSVLNSLGCINDPAATSVCSASTEGLDGAEGVAVAPDGANVYAAGSNDNAVVTFARDAGTGSLSPQNCINSSGSDGCGAATGLGGAHGVAVSPDGANVYVTGQGDAALVVFSRVRPEGGGGGTQKPPPDPFEPKPDACTNPSTLLVTCADPTGL